MFGASSEPASVMEFGFYYSFIDPAKGRKARPTHVKDEPDEIRVGIVTDDDLVILVVLGVRDETQLTYGRLRPLRHRRPPPASAAT